MAQSGSILMRGVRLPLRDFDLRGLSSLEYILAAVGGGDKRLRLIGGVSM